MSVDTQKVPMERLLATMRSGLLLVDDQFVYVSRGDDGERRVKFVSPAAVRSAVAKEPLDSGWISPAVKRCGSGPRGDFAVAWFAPAATKITVVDAKMRAREISVPLPGLLFAGVGKTYSVWATKGKIFSPDGALFRAPLPNVDDAGSICFGSNRVPPASAATVEQAFGVFREAPFNDHMVTARCASKPKDVRDLLFALARQKARTFPERELLSARASVAGVVDDLAGGRARR